MKSTLLSQSFQERVIHTMFATIALLVVVYTLVLLALVFSAIERKQSLLAVRDITSSLSQIEQEYAVRLADINDHTLAAHNFTRIDNSTFAVRKDPIATYTVLYGR